jgi:hypothetical protein
VIQQRNIGLCQDVCLMMHHFIFALQIILLYNVKDIYHVHAGIGFLFSGLTQQFHFLLLVFQDRKFSINQLLEVLRDFHTRCFFSRVFPNFTVAR